MISLLVIHNQYSKYLETSIDINSKNNHIYLLGEDSVNIFKNNKNVTFVNLNQYIDQPKFIKYKDNFVKYGDKSFQWHYFNLVRMLVYKEFMEDYELDSVFSCDSDNIILDNINTFRFKYENALCIPTKWDPFYHATSIHSSLISKNFALKYEKLYNEIFIEKTKFDIVEEKINYHKNNPGGLTDMTLYDYMVESKLVKVQNLLEDSLFENEICIFLNNFSNGEGPKSKNQYQLKRGRVRIYRENNNNYVYDEIDKVKKRLFNIHYQGTAKKNLKPKLKRKINY